MKRISQWRSVSNECEQKKRKSQKLKEERNAGRVDLVRAKLRSWTQHCSEEEKREGSRVGKRQQGKSTIPPQPDPIQATWFIRSLDLEKCQIKASKSLKDSGHRQGGHEDAKDRCIFYKGHFRNSRRRQGDVKISNMTWWVSRKDGRKY